MVKINPKLFPYSGEITSLKDLDSIIAEVSSNYLIENNGVQDYFLNFRGHELSEYELVPTLFRSGDEVESILKKEIGFVEKSIKFSSELFEKNKSDESIKPKIHQIWHYLAQMRHLGIPTRLLDFTIDYRVAMFFTVENKKYYDQDGDLWIFCKKDYFNLEQELVDPFATERDYFFNIPIKFHENFESDTSQRRILSQKGKFLVRPNSKAKIPLEQDLEYLLLLKRFKVPSSSKKIILEDLENEGYNECSLYKPSNQILKIFINKMFENDSI
jgi:hypothetical protein